jgi:recombination protein RecR
MRYPPHLLKLIETLKQLPGVGARSAERFAFHLIGLKKEALAQMGQTIQQIPDQLASCSRCFVLMGHEGCPFCNNPDRMSGPLCVVGSSKDPYTIEKTREFQGRYHVLGALLSPLEGVGPDKLQIPKLIERIQKEEIVEVILALDATLEGDATALYLKRELAPLGVKLSRLAFGMPMGSSFDYVDGGTLARAFSGRGEF